MSEKIFPDQTNYGWGLTFNLTGKTPAINKRIFKTLKDAQDYANDINDSAIKGLLLSVVDDTDETNNGVYFVKRIKEKEDGDPSILEKVGDKPEEIEGLNHVLCSSEEPSEEYRKDYLWLQETDEEITEDDFTVDIRTMQKATLFYV